MYSSFVKLTRQLLANKTGCLLLGLGAVLSTGCSSLDYKRMVYDALRQHDCRVNDPAGEFCSRTFALDYYDYKALRSDYMTALADTSNSATSKVADANATETISATESLAASLNVN